MTSSNALHPTPQSVPAQEIADFLYYRRKLISDADRSEVSRAWGTFPPGGLSAQEVSERELKASAVVTGRIQGLGFDGMVYRNACEDRNSLTWVILVSEQVKAAGQVENFTYDEGWRSGIASIPEPRRRLKTRCAGRRCSRSSCVPKTGRRSRQEPVIAVKMARVSSGSCAIALSAFSRHEGPRSLTSCHASSRSSRRSDANIRTRASACCRSLRAFS